MKDTSPRCLYCNTLLSGRSDKRYCHASCRSTHYYEQRKTKESLFYKIDKQLKRNRRLLKRYNRAGKSYIPADDLLQKGFNPHYFTHFWKNNRGQIYLFCYDFGFLKTTQNGKVRFLLIQWQSYMTTKDPFPY